MERTESTTERSEKTLEGMATAMNVKYALVKCNTLDFSRSVHCTVFH